MLRFVKRLMAVVLILIVVGAVGFFTFAPAYVEKSRNNVIAHAPYPVSDAGAALHADLIIGDWHADSLLWNRDLTERGSY